MIRKIIAALLIGTSAISAQEVDTTAMLEMVNGLLSSLAVMTQVQGLDSGNVGEAQAAIQGVLNNVEHMATEETP